MGDVNDEESRIHEQMGEKALTLLKKGNWQGLVSHCHQWTEINPKNDVAWWLLGHAYQSMGRYKEAIQAYEVAVHFNPALCDAWESLILAHNALNERDKALEAVRELRKYDPKKADEYLDFLISCRKPQTEKS